MNVTVVAGSASKLQLANCVVNGSGVACTSPYSLGNSHALTANVWALDAFGNGAVITSAVTMSVTSADTGNYSITSGGALTIDGSATPPYQSTATFTVQKTSNASNTTTITVHVT